MEWTSQPRYETGIPSGRTEKVWPRGWGDIRAVGPEETVLLLWRFEAAARALIRVGNLRYIHTIRLYEKLCLLLMWCGVGNYLCRSVGRGSWDSQCASHCLALALIIPPPLSIARVVNRVAFSVAWWRGSSGPQRAAHRLAHSSSDPPPLRA